jgi:predicted amidohydrolase
VEISEAKRFLGNFPIEPKKVYSQTGEEGILQYIFENIGTTNNFLVDFGAGDGIWLSNSKLLLDEHEFVGLRMDGNGTNYTGDSGIWGVLGDNLLPFSPEEEQVKSWVISLPWLKEFRKNFPVWMDADEFELK